MRLSVKNLKCKILMPWFLRKIDFDINILIEILKFFKENAKVIEINKVRIK